MIDDETIRKLRELNLDDIVNVLEVQQHDLDVMTQPFDERIKLIVDYLYTQKYNKRIQRLQKMAKFRFTAYSERTAHSFRRNGMLFRY